MTRGRRLKMNEQLSTREKVNKSTGGKEEQLRMEEKLDPKGSTQMSEALAESEANTRCSPEWKKRPPER